MWVESENPVNWVANKDQCTARGALDLFMVHIEKDVEEMNKLPLSRRQYCKFEVTQDEYDGTIKVEKLVEVAEGHDRAGDRKGLTVFEPSSDQDKINVSYRGNKIFTIKLAWNTKKAECRFVVQEKQRHYSLWQISQLALYELFFNKPYSTEPDLRPVLLR